MQQQTLFGDDVVYAKGRVKRVLYSKRNFAIISMTLSGTDDTVNVTGKLAEAEVGSIVEGHFKQVIHPDYGLQFEAQEVNIFHGTSALEGLESFLIYNVKGFGEKTAKAIVKQHGEKTVDVLGSEKRLQKLPGIGAAKAKTIADSWREVEDDYYALSQLYAFGMSPYQVSVAHRHFGRDAFEVLSENMYALTEVRGLGFKLADKIALRNGIDREDDRRLIAAAMYAMQMILNSGDTLVTQLKCITAMLQHAELSRPNAERGMRLAIEDETLVLVGEDVMLPWTKRVEEAIIVHIKSRQHTKNDPLGIKPPPNTLTADQERVFAALDENDLVTLTGLPGCGKTFTVGALVRVARQKGIKMLLCAPTGKAARRLQEMADHQAQTIHRALSFSWQTGKFVFGKNNQLDHKLIICDETSLVDIFLMKSLLDAIPPTSKILLVGDADQLPPVGPGQPFAVQRGSVVRLTKIFRQAADNPIIAGAHAFNKQKPIAFSNDDVRLRFINIEDTKEIVARLPGILADFAKANDGELPQIITPMNGGLVGVEAINAMVKHMINPGDNLPPFKIMNGQIVHLGDLVIQTKNNYRIDMMNGEQGVISHVSPDKLVLDTIDGPKEVSKKDARTLMLGYAISVHKCVDGSTLVETNEGLLPIRDAAKRGRVATPTVAHSYRVSVSGEKREGLRITTEDGYSVIATPEHGFDVWNGERYERKNARDLGVGDFMRLKLEATFFHSDAALPEPPLVDVRAATFDFPDKINPDVAEFFGLMVADGTVFRSGLRLIKRHREVVSRFAQLASSIFGVDAEVAPCHKANGKCFECSVYSVQIAGWLEKVGGMSPNSKAVPESVLRSSTRVQASFLRGLFEDGSVHLSATGMERIELTTAYPELFATVKVMLLRLGIISGWSDAELPRIQIYGQNAKRFEERIGMISHEKRRRLALSAGKETHYRVPVSRSEMKSLGRDRDVFTYQNALATGYLTRDKAEKYDVPWLNERLRFHHSRIASIKPIACKAYCLEVPATSRFLQNGFCGWNSQGAQWPGCLIICHTTHYIMLNKQLFYTAMTRAERNCWFVGTHKAMALARNNSAANRATLMSTELAWV